MSTIGYFIECFQDRIKKDKNPILSSQMQQNANKNSISFYEIEKNTLILHPSKKYKSLNRKVPEKVLLEEGLKIRGKTEILKEKKNEILTKIPELLKKQENNEIQLKTEIPQNNKKIEQTKPLIEEISEGVATNIDKPSYELIEK